MGTDMDYNQAALELHKKGPGKVGITSLVPLKTREDLSTAYTPGVAEPCRRIEQNPDDVYTYTGKGRMVAVISNGTAVLGLGDIGPAAGLPVMEGKAVLFKAFGGVDAIPLCIDAKTPAEVIAFCRAAAPSFGGINLEDIKSPECFEIEQTLEKELDIPVFHDDQHGTAIVLTAALINALRVVGKKMADVRVVLNGPGAAGTAIIKMMMTAGVRDIVAVDQFGTLYRGVDREEAHKRWLGEVTNPRDVRGGLAEAVAGADVFIGVSKPGCLTAEMCRTMARDAIVFAMANPTPEIMPDEAKAGGVRVMATGRSDFPNQVNNVLCFPGLFRGALSVRARDINDAMKLAAAYAIADLVTDADRGPEYIIPAVFDPRVADAVAAAVAKAARESGTARL
jgi:malate dehydrogenase (oxaloacetate-decarboxylating)